MARSRLSNDERMIAPRKTITVDGATVREDVSIYGLIMLADTTFVSLEINGKDASGRVTAAVQPKDKQFFTGNGEVITAYEISGGTMDELYDYD